MAQLNSRGTQTRSRWDYFEHSNGIAFVYGSVTSGGIGAYFINNSTGATAIDVYTLDWFTSVAGLWALSLFPPGTTITPLPILESNVFCLAPDVATPPGQVGMLIVPSPTYRTFIRYSNNSNGGQVAPISGSYFATLPPGWAIAIGGPGSPNPCELSMTVWYQYVLDNVPPAP